MPVGGVEELVHERSLVVPKPRTGGGGFHVIRGGSYEDGAVWIRSASRDTTSLARPAWIGFRCAADGDRD